MIASDLGTEAKRLRALAEPIWGVAEGARQSGFTQRRGGAEKGRGLVLDSG